MPFDPTKPAPGDDPDAVPNGPGTFTPLAMKTRLFLPALLAASLANAQPAAPDATPAKAESAPAATAKTEMQKWIEATDTQWQAAFKRDVTDVREAEVRKVMLQYLNLLEEAIGKASKAGDLKGALALRDEQKRFGDTQLFPEKDDVADTAAAGKEIRTALRAHLAKLETDTAVRAKGLHAKYDQVLAQAQLQLTQAKRLDDALLVQTKRDEVAAAWITPSLEKPGTSTTPATAGQKPAVPTFLGPTATPFQTKSFFSKLKAAAANPRVLKATLPKTPKGTFFVDCPKDGALLAGFEVTMGNWFDAPLISSLQPIYLTATGKVRGELHGKAGRNPKTLEAREGYAVGGFAIHHGTFCWSIELTYMRLDLFRGTLIRTDSYQSEVIGDFEAHPDHKPNAKVGGDGSPILGVFGTAESERINTLGIITVP
jgi:hypothetical protein